LHVERERKRSLAVRALRELDGWLGGADLRKSA
jgi:hypothetical protein